MNLDPQEGQQVFSPEEPSLQTQAHLFRLLLLCLTSSPSPAFCPPQATLPVFWSSLAHCQGFLFSEGVSLNPRVPWEALAFLPSHSLGGSSSAVTMLIFLIIFEQGTPCFHFTLYPTQCEHGLPSWPGSELSPELQMEHWASAPPPLLSGSSASLLTWVSKAVRTVGQTARTVPGDLFSPGQKGGGGSGLHPCWS